MIINDVINYLEQIAPSAYQESYDNARLIVGDKRAELKGILICLDSIEAVIDEAITLGCNLVVAHHPIVFGGLKSLTGKNYIERVVIKAIKNDIAIYVAHTNLDNVLESGVNAKFAEKIGLKNTQILAPKKNMLQKMQIFVPVSAVDKLQEAIFEAGAGEIGNYSECSFNTIGTGSYKANKKANPTIGEIGKRHYEAEQKVEVIYPAYRKNAILRAVHKNHPYEEVAYDIIALENQTNTIGAGIVGDLEEPIDALDFLKDLKMKMKTDCIRYTNLDNKKIKKVAICGGAGSFLLRQAMAAKADIFITGDYKYHQFFDAENKIIIADIGHYESEQYTIELFYELLTQKFINFAIYCTKINTNPINYI